MAVVKLVLAYDGTGFRGWARQPGLRTVQGVLEEALLPLLGEVPRLSVAGRTGGLIDTRPPASPDRGVRGGPWRWAALPC